MTASVTWIDANQLPDSDTTVLVFTPADGEVWLGFHDGECWRSIDAMRMRCRVTYWAHLPEPPVARESQEVQKAKASGQPTKQVVEILGGVA